MLSWLNGLRRQQMKEVVRRNQWSLRNGVVSKQTTPVGTQHVPPQTLHLILSKIQATSALLMDEA